MEQTRLVSLKLPVDMIAALERAARSAGLSPPDFARAALRQALRPAPADPVAQPATDAAPVAAQMPAEAAASPSAALPSAALPSAALPSVDSLAAIFAEAPGWLDLQCRLRAAGVVLRLEGEGLALHTWPFERPLLDENGIWEALGQSLERLSLRFRAPFPGSLPGWRQEARKDGRRPH